MNCIYCKSQIGTRDVEITDEDGSKKNIKIDLSDYVERFNNEKGYYYICKDCFKKGER